MRILIFLPCLTLGGAERQGIQLAICLQERGHNVEVWGFPAPGNLASLIPELSRHKIQYEELPVWPNLDWGFSQFAWSGNYLIGYFRWAMGLLKCSTIIPRRRFDVVIPFTLWPSLISCLFRKRLGAVKCFWNHRGGYDDSGILYNPFLIRRVLAHHPDFVANSNIGGQFLQDTFGLSSAQIMIVPNAYIPEVPRNDSASDSTVPVTLGECVLTHVANFFPEKDYDTLLRAICILNTERQEYSLHFCGAFLSDTDRSKFLARVHELEIQNCVVLHEKIARDKIFRLLKETDIALLSSRSEGQSNSIMEYMYMGLPVIATKIAGVMEIVGQENEKYLFEVGDAAGLAELIKRLRKDPVLRAEIGRVNRCRIIDRYAIEHVLPKWLDLVERSSEG